MSGRTAAFLRGWSLRHRLTVAVAALLSLVVVGLVVAGVLLQRTRAEQARVTRDYFSAYVLSSQVFQQLLNQETAVRGYALTRDVTFLDPYDAADGGIRRDYDRVLDGLRDQPVTQARLEQVAASARRWQTQWAEPALARLRAGEALSDADLARGKLQFDQVRDDVDSFRTSLLEVREASARELRRDTALLFSTVVAGALGAVFAGVALLVLLRRWVTGPVEQLAIQTRAVAGGDLAQHVRTTGPPEIVGLGSDVDGMRRELLTQLDGLKAATEELESARGRLEEQAVELRRSNSELEQFAYVASHDLQEPLRKVASFCQMLARRYEGQLDERADQYIAFAVDGAKRMQQLINDLLAFSRVGRMGSDFVEVDLGTCLASATRSLALVIEETGAQVSADPLPTVMGEPGLLSQVFQNLVGNAIKFRGDGVPQVHIEARRDGDHWELSCQDNGIGIEEAYAERIFVIFQRLHAKDEYAGTGIGLSLCRKIIEYHGGRIWLDSAGDGAGATLRWTLPARDAGGAPAIVAASDRGEVGA